MPENHPRVDHPYNVNRNAFIQSKQGVQEESSDEYGDEEWHSLI